MTLKRLLFILALLASTLAGCTVANVNPGEEAVIIDQPIFGGNEGVREAPFGPGRTVTWPTATKEIYNIQPATEKENFADLMTADNNPVDFDVVLSYQLQAGQTPRLHNDFGRNWYANNVRARFRNHVRDLAKQYKMFELTSNTTVANRIEDSLLVLTQRLFVGQRIPANVLGVSLGKVNPPSEVIVQTNQTAAQVQRIATETQRVLAENARAEAEAAKARADMAYYRTMGWTADQYLQWLMIAKVQNLTLVQSAHGITPAFNVH